MKSDILQTYPSSPVIAAARVAISFVVTFSYPLQSHPACGCLISLIEALQRKCGGEQCLRVLAQSFGTTSVKLLRKICVTVFLILSTIISLVVSDLGVVLSVVGATGSTAVSYILPGGCYYLLFIDTPGFKRNLALFQCVLGIVIVPTALALTFSAKPQR